MDLKVKKEDSDMLKLKIALIKNKNINLTDIKEEITNLGHFLVIFDNLNDLEKEIDKYSFIFLIVDSDYQVKLKENLFKKLILIVKSVNLIKLILINNYTEGRLLQQTEIENEADFVDALIDVVVFLSRSYHVNEKEKIDISEYLISSSAELITTAQKEKIEILSFNQEGVLHFINKQKNNWPHIPILIMLSPSINILTFEKSIQAVIFRHEILHTLFSSNEQGDCCQVIVDKPVDIIMEAIVKQDLDLKVAENIERSFDLNKQYPIKIKIFKIEDTYYCLFIFHQLAFDRSSIPIFLNDLYHFYESFNDKFHTSPDPLVVQYKDFSQRQRSFLVEDNLLSEINLWEKILSGRDYFSFPTDYPKSGKKYKEATYYFNLGLDLSKEIYQFIKNTGVELFPLMLAAFYVLLHKYTQREDILIGTTVSNPDLHGLGQIIGPLDNELALRYLISDDMTFIQAIQEVQEVVSEAKNHQYISFLKLLELLKIPIEEYVYPLFDVILELKSFSNFPVLEHETSKYFNILDTNQYFFTKKPNLIFSFNEDEEQLAGRVVYNANLFHEETVAGLVKHYAVILKQVISNSNIKISQVNTVLDDEKYLITKLWNQTELKLPKKEIFINLFECQAKRTPDNVAVIFGDQQLTYRELHEETNQLARYILEGPFSKEIKPDSFILVYVERSLEMLIALLAIMKVGSAYVPIDPGYPAERVEFIVKDTQAILVLSQSHFINTFEVLPLDTQRFIAMDKKEYLSCSKEDLALNSRPEHLVYAIYTSGSTGKPKGVLIENRNLVNALFALDEIVEINSQDNMLGLAPITFDIAGLELFLPLMRGACCVIISRDAALDMNEMIKLIQKHHITIIQATPATWHLLLNSGWDFNPMIKILCGGEALPVKLANQITSKREFFWNVYGPTETTIWSTVYKVTNKNQESSNISIGKPLANTLIYILDAHQKLVPIGGIGELYIGGAGVARGYLERDNLTAEKFILNPFDFEGNDEIYSRIYRTGDLVRWLADGNLEYIGRNDTQIKLRGHRIELGEIENILTSYPGIKQSVVMVKGEKVEEKIIVAYYVSNSPIEVNNLTHHLSRLIPDYAVPNYFVHLSKFPVSMHGKIDRKALPEPAIENKEIIELTSDYEKIIAKVWSKILEIKTPLGKQSDFFELGGHSLLVFKILKGIKQNLNIALYPKDIFEHKTIESLAKYIDIQESQSQIESEQGQLSGSFDLLPIQSWFFEQNVRDKTQYHISFLMKVPALEVEKIKSTIEKLANHHDMLRVVFTQINGPVNLIKQTYCKKALLPKLNLLDCKNLTENEIKNKLTNLHNSFDLENGPLWQISYLVNDQNQGQQLFFSFHYLIADYFSEDIIAKDFKIAYEGGKLLKKTGSYRQWVEIVKKYAYSSEQQTYRWKAQIKGQPDYKNFTSISIRPSIISLKIDAAKTELLQQANKAKTTVTRDLLISALVLTLKQWHGSDESYLTMENPGREQSLKDGFINRLNYYSPSIDLSKSVGWFNTLFPVKFTANENIGSTIVTVKETLRSFRNNGLGYGALKYFSPSQSLRTHQLPAILFSYLNKFETENLNWQLTHRAVGLPINSEDSSPWVLDIKCYLQNQEINFSIYSQLSNEINQLLMDNFQKYIDEIINYCHDKIKNNEIEFTPSDLRNTYESITVLNPNIKEPTLIILPPAGGGSESYLGTLCPRLSKQLKIVLLDNYLLKTNNELNLHSFEELATYYIGVLSDNGILENLPSNSCYLAGWSMGSNIAYEVMLELQKRDIKVINNFLVDPVVPALLGKDFSQYVLADILKQYNPESSENRITIFRSTEYDESFPLSEIMIKVAYLGFDKINQNIQEYLLDRPHMQLFEFKYILDFIATIINETIRQRYNV